MSGDDLGKVLSLLAAVTFAISLLLYRKVGETVPPLALNLFKNVFALGFFMVAWLFVPAALDELRVLTTEHWIRTIVSAAIGIALADTLFLYGINRLGVGLMSVVDCLYSPSVVVLGALLLGEHAQPHQLLGGAFVLSGVAVAAYHAPPPGTTRRQLLLGIAAAGSGAILMGVGIIIFRPVLQAVADAAATSADPNAAITFAGGLTLGVCAVRLFCGTLPLIPVILARKDRWDLLSAFRPAPHWKQSVSASFMSTFLCFWFWNWGFAHADLGGVAAILNQSSTVIAIILATIFLREPLTKRKIAALTLGVSGVLLVIMDFGSGAEVAP